LLHIDRKLTKEKILTEQKKNLFDRALDALTNRDGKATAKVAADKSAAAKAAAFSGAAVKVAAGKTAAVNAVALKTGNEEVARQKATAARVIAQKADTEIMEAAKAAAAAPKKGVVTVKSLRIRADHTTKSEVVAGLVNGNEVLILSTWSDGKNTWAKLDKGWAAMDYDSKTYIKLA
jgi:hypothetical protein